MLVLAIADGAGSAALGDVGASVAVRSAVAAVTSQDGRLPLSCDETAWRSCLSDILFVTRDAVEAEARAHGASFHDLATTLALVVATGSCVAALHLGDGAVIIHDTGGELIALTTPQVGEYLNETTFLSSPDAVDTARISIWHGSVRHICVMSDGLQMLALRIPEGIPHGPFFKPLFRFIEQMSDETTAQEQFAAFLSSSRIAERTDDDVTLCLAAHRPAECETSP